MVINFLNATLLLLERGRSKPGVFKCGHLNRRNTLIKESANNSHSKKAVLFLREAGAKVGDSYQVSITDYKTEFDTTAVGNTFTVDDDHGKARLNSKAINFNWISADTLEISYDKNLRTFIQEKAIDGVIVVYKAK
jgi:hypothetical protein